MANLEAMALGRISALEAEVERLRAQVKDLLGNLQWAVETLAFPRHPGWEGPSPMGGGDYVVWERVGERLRKEQDQWDRNFKRLCKVMKVLGKEPPDRWRMMR